MTLLAHVAEFPYSASYRQELLDAGEDVESVMSAAFDGMFVRDLPAWCAAVLAMHEERWHRRLIDGLLTGAVHPLDAYDEVDAAVGLAMGSPARKNAGRPSLRLRPLLQRRR